MSFCRNRRWLQTNRPPYQTPALATLLGAFALAFVLIAATVGKKSTPYAHFDVVAVYPHDRRAYTQGLFYVDGLLIESTGLHGQSSLRAVRLDNGRVARHVPLPNRYFAEGVALVGNRIIQLTWKANTAFIYDAETLNRIAVAHYPGQGWGLIYDGHHLILSDGTPVLRILEPRTLDLVRTIEVTLNGEPLTGLNELAVVRGEIWANIYPTPKIARINPANGQVIGLIDASALRERLPKPQRAGVLNGIAYDKGGNRIFVTGKLWPYTFEVQLVGAGG